MRHGLHRLKETILSTSRAPSPQLPALPDVNTVNTLPEPPGVAGNKSQDAILPKPSTHTRIDLVEEAPGVARTIIETNPPRGDEPSTSDRPSQQFSSICLKKNYSEGLKEVGNGAWKALDTALRLLAQSADACPPLKSALGGLVACVDLTQVSYSFWFHILDRF